MKEALLGKLLFTSEGPGLQPVSCCTSESAPTQPLCTRPGKRLLYKASGTSTIDWPLCRVI